MVSRNGVALFRNATAEPDSVAQALQAGSLIQGSVEQEGDRLRVTARLVDGNSGADLDRSTINLPASRLLATRDSVVGEVARLLRERLGANVRLMESRAGTASLDAWSRVQRAERMRKRAAANREAGKVDSAAALYSSADSLLQLAQNARSQVGEPLTLRSQGAVRALQTGEGSVPARAHAGHGDRACHASAGTAACLRLSLGLARSRKAVSLHAGPLPGCSLSKPTSRLGGGGSTGGHRGGRDASRRISRVEPTVLRPQGQRLCTVAARDAYELTRFFKPAHQRCSSFSGHTTIWSSSPTQNAGANRRASLPDGLPIRRVPLWLLIAPSKPADVRRLGSRRSSESCAPKNGVLDYSLPGSLSPGVGQSGVADSARGASCSPRARTVKWTPSRRLSYSALVYILLGDNAEACPVLKSYVLQHPTHEFLCG